jgi:uncharacterized protein YlxP (DUF503 family)
MFFGLARIRFEDDGSSRHDQRVMHNLVSSIRSKFKVSASSEQGPEDSASLGIVVACVGSSDDSVQNKLQSISKYAESAGMGRIDMEQSVVEHFDILDEQEDEDEDSTDN